MVPIGPWQYNFTSEGGQPLYNSKIMPKTADPKVSVFRGSNGFNKIMISYVYHGCMISRYEDYFIKVRTQLWLHDIDMKIIIDKF